MDPGNSLDHRALPAINVRISLLNKSWGCVRVFLNSPKLLPSNNIGRRLLWQMGSFGYDAVKGFAVPDHYRANMEVDMQTDIEILETRETPCILWGLR